MTVMDVTVMTAVTDVTDVTDTVEGRDERTCANAVHPESIASDHLPVTEMDITSMRSLC